MPFNDLPSLRKYGRMEGNVSTNPLHLEGFRHIVRTFIQPHDKVLQIGFNAGHSTMVMLEIWPELDIHSVDIGEHKYVHDAHSTIDRLWEGRHRLTIGSSVNVLPTLEEGAFDVVFIDGCHEAPIPYIDILNSIKVCKAGGVIIMDDVVRGPHMQEMYTFDPSEAWERACVENIITRGQVFTYCKGHGMAVGYTKAE